MSGAMTLYSAGVVEAGVCRAAVRGRGVPAVSQLPRPRAVRADRATLAAAARRRRLHVLGVQVQRHDAAQRPVPRRLHRLLGHARRPART